MFRPMSYFEIALIINAYFDMKNAGSASDKAMRRMRLICEFRELSKNSIYRQDPDYRNDEEIDAYLEFISEYEHNPKAKSKKISIEDVIYLLNEYKNKSLYFSKLLGEGERKSNVGVLTKKYHLDYYKHLLDMYSQKNADKIYGSVQLAAEFLWSAKSVDLFAQTYDKVQEYVVGLITNHIFRSIYNRKGRYLSEAVPDLYEYIDKCRYSFKQPNVPKKTDGLEKSAEEQKTSNENSNIDVNIHHGQNKTDIPTSPKEMTPSSDKPTADSIVQRKKREKKANAKWWNDCASSAEAFSRMIPKELYRGNTVIASGSSWKTLYVSCAKYIAKNNNINKIYGMKLCGKYVNITSGSGYYYMKRPASIGEGIYAETAFLNEEFIACIDRMFDIVGVDRKEISIVFETAKEDTKSSTSTCVNGQNSTLSAKESSYSSSVSPNSGTTHAKQIREQTNQIIKLDWNRMPNMDRTIPVSIALLGKSKFTLRDWDELYEFALNAFLNNYPNKIRSLQGEKFVSDLNGLSLVGRNMFSSLKKPVMISSGLYAEGDLSPNQIVNSINYLINACRVNSKYVILDYKKCEDYKEDYVSDSTTLVTGTVTHAEQQKNSTRENSSEIKRNNILMNAPAKAPIETRQDQEMFSQFPNLYGYLYDIVVSTGDEWIDTEKVQFRLGPQYEKTIRKTTIYKIYSAVSWAECSGFNYRLAAKYRMNIPKDRQPAASVDSTSGGNGQQAGKGITEHSKYGYTIAQAAVEVLKTEKRLMTAKEIYEKILECDYYVFGATDPLSVVKITLNRSCDTVRLTRGIVGTPVFAEIMLNGEYHYCLVSDKQKYIPTKVPTKTESEETKQSETENDHVTIGKSLVAAIKRTLLETQKRMSSKEIYTYIKEHKYYLFESVKNPEMDVYVTLRRNTSDGGHDKNPLFASEIDDDNTRRYYFANATLASTMGTVSFGVREKTSDIDFIDGNAKEKQRERNPKWETILKEDFPDGFILEDMLCQFQASTRWEERYNEPCPLAGEAIDRAMRETGSVKDGRVFPTNDDEKQLLVEIADNISDLLKTYYNVYASMIYQRYHDELANIAIYSDKVMIQQILPFSKGRFVFAYDCIFARSFYDNVSVAQDCEYVLRKHGGAMSVQEIADELWFIPHDTVYGRLSGNERCINIGNSMWMLAEHFPLSKDDVSRIGDMFDEYFVSHPYIKPADIPGVLLKYLPTIAENASELNSNGIFNLLFYYLKDRFNFSKSIISPKGTAFNNGSLFQAFAEEHDSFTMDELIAFASEFHGAIYWGSLHNGGAVRVTRNEFVNYRKLSFDINAIDNSLESICTADYISLYQIPESMLLLLPSCGYPWTGFLLMSYVNSYSKKYKLVTYNFAKTGYYGAIVRRSREDIDCYDDLVVQVLTDDNSWNTEEEAKLLLQKSGYQATNYLRGVGRLIDRAKHNKMENEERNHV